MVTIFLPIIEIVLADRGGGGEGGVPLSAIAIIAVYQILVGAVKASIIIVVTLIIILMIGLHSFPVGSSTELVVVGRMGGGCHPLLPMRSLAVLLLLAIGRGAIPGTTATVAPTTTTYMYGRIAGAAGKSSLSTAALDLAIVVDLNLILILLGS